MNHRSEKYLLIFILVSIFSTKIPAQKISLTDLVNPFIGTGRSEYPSFWGAEGGTYPGAVAPFGSVQITPETNITSEKGYNYRDSLIYFFSCTGHMSGYPNGSSGSIHIMPIDASLRNTSGNFCRQFRHEDEKATPGYYSVLFPDNGTRVEASASVRTGMIRMRFPKGVLPAILLGDIRDMKVISQRIIYGNNPYSVISFSRDILKITKQDSKPGYPTSSILTFRADKESTTEIIVKIAVSGVSPNSALAAMEKEAGDKSFDAYTEENRSKWEDVLSAIEIGDPSMVNKIKTYTALYHSMLLPWVISDTEGNYMGVDRKIHKTSGENEYAGFSPWDTFRSLHPLLCLLQPQRQKDMILSALDFFNQTGRLPGGPMTGNHIVAIIADSWMKGIRPADGDFIFKAMKTTIDAASSAPDMKACLRLGYVPSSYPESVTRTVEYAYNDWVMAHFADSVLTDKNISEEYLKRSFNYRNLSDTATLYLVPRQGNILMREPGYFGYKEGDKHSYSLFVPHNPVDLVNFSGGPAEFAGKLDSELTDGKIYFDNEPVLHIPYLFNYSEDPWLTQKWVKSVMKTRYLNSPGGLPGNDDLGAMSSWFVFSAIGLYPLCPGKAVYDIGSPLFAKVTLHLTDGKKFIIRSVNNSDENIYVQSASLNGQELDRSQITHSELMEGREMVFMMGPRPQKNIFRHLLTSNGMTENYSDFRVTDFSLSATRVKPDEEFRVRYTASNMGSPGIGIIRIFADGREIAAGTILADSGRTETGYLSCRLYASGIRKIKVGDLNEKEIEVYEPSEHGPAEIKAKEITGPSVLRADSTGKYSVTLKNISGHKSSYVTEIYSNDHLVRRESISPEPGEEIKMLFDFTPGKSGIFELHVLDCKMTVKAYITNSEAVIASLKTPQKGDTIYDYSGFKNNGIITRLNNTCNNLSPMLRTGDSCFLNLNNSPSLDLMGNSVTVMAWICPGNGNHGLTDIITKGDFLAIQSSGNRTISFFAGGWGRGSCEASLPENWLNNWHHITGVSDGRFLRIYIDGKESGNFDAGSPANLSYDGKWMIGRNEEFPGERIFHGAIRNFKIFSVALTSSEIKKEMEEK